MAKRERFEDYEAEAQEELHAEVMRSIIRRKWGEIKHVTEDSEYLYYLGSK